jgi:hypothetical protein
MMQPTVLPKQRQAAPESFPNAPLRTKHPLFHLFMLVIGVPAAILACIALLPFRLFMDKS